MWRGVTGRNGQRRLARAALWAGVAGLLAIVGCSSETPAPTAQGSTGTDVTAACRVTRVVDGDTVYLACPGAAPERARLMGFDTPEIFSPHCASEMQEGLAAKTYLRRQIAAADTIGMSFAGRDRYGRRLVHLSLDGRDTAAIMIGAGLARPYYGGRRRGWCG